MDGAAGRFRDLLRIADASRAAGDGNAARTAYVRVYEAARTVRDVDTMTRAAMGLAAGQMFGTVPGAVPALLFEAYTCAAGVQRARVAVALARTWVYGGDPARAVSFAEEAIGFAERIGDRTLLADALDAQLLVHWGPDDLAERLRITRRLEDAVVHLTDVEARMTAHLWRLTTALECLDLPATQRQLRALDALAEESGSHRVRFFAAARRGMYALLVGNLEAAARARDEAVAAGTAAGEADTLAIDRTLSAFLALQAGDTDGLVREAALYEQFGSEQGYPSIVAKGAVLWLAAGRADRAGALLHPLAGRDLSGVPRDVDWLLTVTALTEVAAGTGATELADAGARLLEPYAGRGVLNAGGTAFLGVVDDFRYRALLSVGRVGDAEAQRRAAADAYRRMGAGWWLRRVAGAHGAALRPADVVHLHPAGGGVWTVGTEGATHAVREMRGLQYLRLLLERPGRDVPALDLSDAVAGHPGVQVAERDVGPVVDRQALMAYRQRLVELDDALAEADAWGDPLRAARLSAEREALLVQVAEATGLGGRPRGTVSGSERARVAVRKAIAASVARIAVVDPALARLLRNSVATGALCRYEPDPGRPVRWVLSGTSPGRRPVRP